MHPNRSRASSTVGRLKKLSERGSVCLRRRATGSGSSAVLVLCDRFKYARTLSRQSHMRLFTALELSPEVLIRLERLTSVLRPEALINWSPLDNLHITTKFIGEWPETRLDDLGGAP